MLPLNKLNMRGDKMVIKVLKYDITNKEYAARLGSDWTLTTSSDGESIYYMKLYLGATNFRLASYNDIVDYVSSIGVKNEIITGLIQLKEGLYQYQFYQNNMKICGEYRRVGDKRAIVA